MIKHVTLLLTFDPQVNERFLVSLPGAGVALVPPLILNFHFPQHQRGVSLCDLGIKQAGPAAEMLVLEAVLVFIVVVAVDGGLLLVPVDDHGSCGLETAGQHAVFIEQTCYVCI